MPFATQRRDGAGSRRASQLRTGRSSGPRGNEKGIVGLGLVSAFGALAPGRRAAALLLVAPTLLGLSLAPSSTEFGLRQRRHPHPLLHRRPHQRIGHVHLYGRRRLRSADARQAELVHARLATERVDQDGPETLRHRLGGLPRVGLETADRRALRLPLAPDQRPAARRSRQVAKYSQHMEGKAIDAHFIDVDTATIRDIAMRMERAASASTRAATRPGCTSTAATFATGRA